MTQNQKRFLEAYEKAFQRIDAWTLGTEVNVGRVKLRDGRMALVRISIETDQSEIEDACSSFEELIEIGRPDRMTPEDQEHLELLETLHKLGHKWGLSPHPFEGGTYTVGYASWVNSEKEAKALAGAINHAIQYFIDTHIQPNG